MVNKFENDAINILRDSALRVAGVAETKKL